MTGMKQKAAKAGDWEELTNLLWDAARAGNVPAMRILRDEMRHADQDTVETPSILDELAAKRAETAG
jgi:hypothetical protein